MVITSAMATTVNEFTTRIRSNSATGVPDASDVPRSPESIPPTQSRYWRHTGRSRPSSARRRASCSGVALWPRIVRAMSPGSAWVAANTSTDTVASIATPVSTRLTTRRVPIPADFGMGPGQPLIPRMRKLYPKAPSEFGYGVAPVTLSEIPTTVLTKSGTM